MNHDDETLLDHVRAPDLLWMADKCGFGDELRARLAARHSEFCSALDEAVEPSESANAGAPPAPAELGPAPVPVSSRRAADVEPPPPYQLGNLYDAGPVTVMLTGPAWCVRADYETFCDAGGSVDTRGYAFELREVAPEPVVEVAPETKEEN
jgi:hypothetical protein